MCEYLFFFFSKIQQYLGFGFCISGGQLHLVFLSTDSRSAAVYEQSLEEDEMKEAQTVSDPSTAFLRLGL